METRVRLFIVATESGSKREPYHLYWVPKGEWEEDGTRFSFNEYSIPYHIWLASFVF